MPSYASRIRVRRIDDETWRPSGELSGVDSASVTRSVAKDAPLMQSGDMDVSGIVSEGHYAIDMVEDTGNVHPIATLLFAPDGTEWSHRSWSGSLAGRSVLAPAAERRTRQGEYAPKGAMAAALCARMLRESIAAPVVVEGDFALGEHVVFDLGGSYLDAVLSVLDTGGFCVQVSGDGTVTIREMPTEPSLVINSANRGLLMPKITRRMPISDVPNVLYVYDGDQEAVAVNDDPTSPTSIQARGRRIEQVEENPTRKEGETLQQYADRRLAELSDVYETYDVEHEWVDGLLPYSIVRVNLPEAGIDGDFRVMDQDLECGRGIQVGATWGRRAL